MIGLVSTILMVAGTIVATLGGARLPAADPFVTGAGIAILLAGIVLRKIAVRNKQKLDKSASSAGIGRAGGQPVVETMKGLLEKLEQNSTNAKHARRGTELAGRLAALEPDLYSVADTAPALLDVVGAQTFALAFSEFAQGERALRRAWSAAADGHDEEARASLSDAIHRIRSAIGALETT